MTQTRAIILVLLLWLVGLGASAQFAKIAVPFAEFSTLYPNAGSGIGWALSIISLIGIFMGMMAGLFTNRLGLINVLLFGIAIGGVISLWQATVPSFPVMLFSRLIEGISHLIIVVVAPTLIAQFSPQRLRPFAMTLWSTFFGVSFALTAWVGLPFVQSHGLEPIFTLHGGYMLIMALMLFFVFRRFGISIPKSKTPLSPRTLLAQHITAFKSARISAPAIGWLFYTMTFVSLLAILPGTIPLHIRATLVGVMPLISIATALIIVPALLTRLTAVSVVILGFIIAMLTTALTFTSVAMPYIWVTLFAVLGLIQGASFATVPELNATATDQATSNGVMAQAGNLGNTIGTPILLLVLNSYGVNGMLAAVAIIYACGAIGHLWLRKLRTTQT